MFLRSYTDNPEVTQLQNVYDVSDAQYITRVIPTYGLRTAII